MATYVLRRVLLMIPTFFGISFVVWLVMVLSPGRIGTSGGAMGSSEEKLSGDPTKLAQANDAERIFRRQFGLDRPSFLNTWYSLGPDELRETIAVAHGDIEKVGVDKQREARETLEDYGYYAVPALVELLQTTEGHEQDLVRYWLGRSSVRLSIKASGAAIDKATLARFREWTRENRALAKLTWEPGAPRQARDQVVRKWVDWYQTHRKRWEHSGWDKARILLTDTQFGTYWGRLLHGDLGSSHVHKRPVLELVLERLKFSLSLNLVALVIAYLLAVPLGVFTAAKQGSLWDRGIGILLLMLYSLPNFFVGTLLLRWLTMGEPYKLFPTGGFEAETSAHMSTLVYLKDVLWHITLPLVCLTYGVIAFLSRFARSGMLDVIRSDYVRTARAKGLSGYRVVCKHVVRNGILPVVTLLGGALPVLIGGSIAIEFIFNINGMGLLVINSIFQKDFNVVMGIQLIVGVLTMVGILLADLAYALLDPRISLS